MALRRGSNQKVAFVAEIAIPRDVRNSVIRELYRQVGSLDWEDIPSREKSNYYTRWVEDPAIGGELADYYTADGMRVWLKDVPLKEYARALESFGSFARYTTKRLSPPNEFIPKVLGDAWGIVPASTGEKPMHCLVTNGDQQRYVCWGKARSFRDLLWAAVNQALDSPVRPLVVVYLTEGKSIIGSERRQHERIAEHCDLDLAYVFRRVDECTQG
ncbi:hypothetical protein [Micromonospora sp. NPDC005189]|uniref:hypothetical protein n=1 Tax=Micromonospora sp. NPDC005189 TaxID=3157019 RepID=UPI0033ADF5E4